MNIMQNVRYLPHGLNTKIDAVSMNRIVASPYVFIFISSLSHWNRKFDDTKKTLIFSLTSFISIYSFNFYFSLFSGKTSKFLSPFS